MSGKTKPDAKAAKAAKTGARNRGKPLDGSKEARKTSSLILEVLSGLRTPTEASEVLGVSLPRYYQLETRGLQGLVEALEPRGKGYRRPNPERKLAKLREECERLEKELKRSQALVRMAQRTVGVPSVEAQRKAHAKKGKKQRRHKPRARAERAIARLDPPEPEPTQPDAK